MATPWDKDYVNDFDNDDESDDAYNGNKQLNQGQAGGGNQNGPNPPQQQQQQQQQQQPPQQQYQPQQQQFQPQHQQQYPQQQQQHQQQQPQQQYPPQQQQYNQGGNWNSPPQQPMGDNWQQPTNEHQRLNQAPNSSQWQNDPQVTVKQKGNTTVTETTQSGGGRDSEEWTVMDVEVPEAVKKFGPQVTSQGVYKPQNEQEQIDYFRLKLWESGCMCCSAIAHPCLNLWVWAIFWLCLFIVNCLINLLVYLSNLGSGSGAAYSVLAGLITIGSLAVNAWALYALFKLKPKAFLLQNVFFIILLLMVLVGVVVYGTGAIFTAILFIVCDVWALWVFIKVYKWAKYFKDGGEYNPDMRDPPK